jgi:hypothetical protein
MTCSGCGRGIGASGRGWGPWQGQPSRPSRDWRRASSLGLPPPFPPSPPHRQLYEERDALAQRRIIRRVYARDAVYQNNVRGWGVAGLGAVQGFGGLGGGGGERRGRVHRRPAGPSPRPRDATSPPPPTDHARAGLGRPRAPLRAAAAHDALGAASGGRDRGWNPKCSRGQTHGLRSTSFSHARFPNFAPDTFTPQPHAPSEVRVLYEPPVVLGATTSSPDALESLGFKGDLEVEVKNSQTCERSGCGAARGEAAAARAQCSRAGSAVRAPASGLVNPVAAASVTAPQTTLFPPGCCA